jgi:hypothetical protein
MTSTIGSARAALVGVWLVLSCTAARAQAPPGAPAQSSEAPKLLDPPDLFSKAEYVRAVSASYGLTSSYVVEGTRIFDGPVLLARDLVFQPGSRLVLEDVKGFSGEQGERYIAARTIRVLPGGATPIITWGRPQSSEGKPVPVGKAGPGPMGATHGSEGGPGEPGQIGNPGYPGRSAPSVIVFVSQWIGGPLAVDLAGQAGQEGGLGQQGGDGGFGRQGSPGVTSLFDCRSGGGDGGRGGVGGAGGRGGTGGRGGNGGTFVVVSTENTIKTALEALTVSLAGGAGGPGGKGGSGGGGGQGGSGGNGSGHCRGGMPGPNGGPGPEGLAGASGPDGVPGLYGFSHFSPGQLNRALGAPSQAK